MDIELSKFLYAINNYTLNEKIRWLRKNATHDQSKKGYLSSEALAEETGIAIGTLNYLETGKKGAKEEKFDCKLSTIIEIADYFGVSIDWLCSRSNVSDTDYGINYICDYTGLSEEAVKELHRNTQISFAEVARQTAEIAGDIDKNELTKGDILNAFIERAYYKQIISCVQDYYIALKKYKKPIENFIPEMEERLKQVLDGSMTDWFDTDRDRIKGISGNDKAVRFTYYEMQDIVTDFADDFCQEKKAEYEELKDKFYNLKTDIEDKMSEIYNQKRQRRRRKHGNDQEAQ